MNYNKILPVLLLIIAFLMGCKKDKPLISFSDINYRIVGDWKLDRISTSANNYNGLYNGQGGSTDKFYKPTVLKLYKDRTASLSGNILSIDAKDTLYPRNLIGSWEVNDDKLTLHWDGDSNYNPEHTVYDISFCSKKELGITRQVVNSGGGITADYNHNFKFVK